MAADAGYRLRYFLTGYFGGWPSVLWLPDVVLGAVRVWAKYATGICTVMTLVLSLKLPLGSSCPSSSSLLRNRFQHPNSR